MVEGQSRRVRRLPMAFGPGFETLTRSYPDGTSETSKTQNLISFAGLELVLRVAQALVMEAECALARPTVSR